MSCQEIPRRGYYSERIQVSLLAAFYENEVPLRADAPGMVEDFGWIGLRRGFVELHNRAASIDPDE